MKMKNWGGVITLCICFVICIGAFFNGKSEILSKNKQFEGMELLQRFHEIKSQPLGEKLSFAAFFNAFQGYQNLVINGEIDSNNQILSILDLSQSANTDRFWVLDLKNNIVLYNTYCAHGKGSGEEFANSFSNVEQSLQTSLGFYRTGETYQGGHGLSMYLHGLDTGYNDAAYKRYIVVHGADYVSTEFISKHQRLGRSWGCPALPQELTAEIINKIKEGSCLFLYYPDSQYLSDSKWIKKETTTFVAN
jgi:hypothetical protein